LLLESLITGLSAVKQNFSSGKESVVSSVDKVAAPIAEFVDKREGKPIGQFLVPLIVGCALFMQTLDSTVIATALPAMARSLNEDPIRLNLAITAYLLSLAVFIPISTWVADKFGARTVFRYAILLFTIGSVFCGLSQSLPELVAARILQGLGGAMLVPVGRLLVLKTVPKSDWVEAMSYLTVPSVLGPVIGPPIGGFIVTYYSWRWIFFINVPICLLGLALVTLFIKNIREPEVPPLDLRGFILTGIGLAGLVFGFESVGRGVLPISVVIGLMLGGLGCSGLYVLHARRTAQPIIDLRLVKIPTFSSATFSGGMTRMATGAMPFLLAMLLQLGFGLSPFASGMLTFASAAGALTMKFTVNPIIRRFGFRSVLVVNGVISSFFVACCALFQQSTPHSVILLALLLGGFFRSLQFTSLNALAYADVPDSLVSNASSLASMAQQLFMTFGVAGAALVLQVSLRLHGETALSAHDITPAFVINGLLSFVSALLFLMLTPHAGAELSGRGPVAIPSQPEPLAD
jgi:EmrB/QacA subfamily drug resistance transporter